MCYIVHMYFFFHITSSEPAEIHILILIWRMKKQTLRACTCLNHPILKSGNVPPKSVSFLICLFQWSCFSHPTHYRSHTLGHVIINSWSTVISVLRPHSQYHSCLSNSLLLIPQLQQSFHPADLYSFLPLHFMTLHPLCSVYRPWSVSVTPPSNTCNPCPLDSLQLTNSQPC